MHSEIQEVLECIEILQSQNTPESLRLASEGLDELAVILAQDHNHRTADFAEYKTKAIQTIKDLLSKLKKGVLKRFQVETDMEKIVKELAQKEYGDIKKKLDKFKAGFASKKITISKLYNDQFVHAKYGHVVNKIFPLTNNAWKNFPKDYADNPEFAPLRNYLRNRDPGKTQHYVTLLNNLLKNNKIPRVKPDGYEVDDKNHESGVSDNEERDDVVGETRTIGEIARLAFLEAVDVGFGKLKKNIDDRVEADVRAELGEDGPGVRHRPDGDAAEDGGAGDEGAGGGESGVGDGGEEAPVPSIKEAFEALPDLNPETVTAFINGRNDINDGDKERIVNSLNQVIALLKDPKSREHFVDFDSTGKDIIKNSLSAVPNPDNYVDKIFDELNKPPASEPEPEPEPSRDPDVVEAEIKAEFEKIKFENPEKFRQSLRNSAIIPDEDADKLDRILKKLVEVAKSYPKANLVTNGGPLIKKAFDQLDLNHKDAYYDHFCDLFLNGLVDLDESRKPFKESHENTYLFKLIKYFWPDITGINFNDTESGIINLYRFGLDGLQQAYKNTGMPPFISGLISGSITTIPPSSIKKTTDKIVTLIYKKYAPEIVANDFDHVNEIFKKVCAPGSEELFKNAYEDYIEAVNKGGFNVARPDSVISLEPLYNPFFNYILTAVERKKNAAPDNFQFKFEDFLKLDDDTIKQIYSKIPNYGTTIYKSLYHNKDPGLVKKMFEVLDQPVAQNIMTKMRDIQYSQADIDKAQKTLTDTVTSLAKSGLIKLPDDMLGRTPPPVDADAQNDGQDESVPAQKTRQDVPDDSVSLADDTDDPSTLTWEDFIGFKFEDLRKIYGRAGMENVGTALKGAEPNMKDIWFNALPTSEGQNLADHMQAAGPLRLSIVESAMKELVETAINMANKKEIQIPKNRITPDQQDRQNPDPKNIDLTTFQGQKSYIKVTATQLSDLLKEFDSSITFSNLTPLGKLMDPDVATTILGSTYEAVEDETPLNEGEFLELYENLVSAQTGIQGYVVIRNKILELASQLSDDNGVNALEAYINKSSILKNSQALMDSTAYTYDSSVGFNEVWNESVDIGSLTAEDVLREYGEGSGGEKADDEKKKEKEEAPVPNPENVIDDELFKEIFIPYNDFFKKRMAAGFNTWFFTKLEYLAKFLSWEQIQQVDLPTKPTEAEFRQAQEHAENIEFNKAALKEEIALTLDRWQKIYNGLEVMLPAIKKVIGDNSKKDAEKNILSIIPKGSPHRKACENYLLFRGLGEKGVNYAPQTMPQYEAAAQALNDSVAKKATLASKYSQLEDLLVEMHVGKDEKSGKQWYLSPKDVGRILLDGDTQLVGLLTLNGRDPSRTMENNGIGQEDLPKVQECYNKLLELDQTAVNSQFKILEDKLWELIKQQLGIEEEAQPKEEKAADQNATELMTDSREKALKVFYGMSKAEKERVMDELDMQLALVFSILNDNTKAQFYKDSEAGEDVKQLVEKFGSISVTNDELVEALDHLVMAVAPRANQEETVKKPTEEAQTSIPPEIMSQVQKLGSKIVAAFGNVKNRNDLSGRAIDGFMKGSHFDTFKPEKGDDGSKILICAAKTDIRDQNMLGGIQYCLPASLKTGVLKKYYDIVDASGEPYDGDLSNDYRLMEVAIVRGDSITKGRIETTLVAPAEEAGESTVVSPLTSMKPKLLALGANSELLDQFATAATKIGSGATIKSSGDKISVNTTEDYARLFCITILDSIGSEMNKVATNYRMAKGKEKTPFRNKLIDIHNTIKETAAALKDTLKENELIIPELGERIDGGKQTSNSPPLGNGDNIMVVVQVGIRGVRRPSVVIGDFRMKKS